jgi:branched-chain amino acid transport system substrate-binding protein
MKRRTLVFVTAVTTALALVAALAVAGTSAVKRSNAISCKSTIKIAFLTPLTGDAGFLGGEQALWAKYAVKTLPAQLGLKVRLLLGDTQLDPALASSLAQRYVADAGVMLIIGPSTSGAVVAVSKALFDAKLAHISPSATRTSLTKSVDGKPKEATPAFFRVVADDGIQGPADARYMIDKLNAKKVVIIDSQEPYSVGLSDQTQAYLKSKGIATQRESVSATLTDFSSIVTKVPSDADIVFFATQQPPRAQTLAQQLLEQGKKAKVFGTDGSADADKFNVPGSYVSNFAAPIDLYDYNEEIIAGWQKDNPSEKLGVFGPPTYGAVQVGLNAIKRACDKKGGSIERVDVLRQVKSVRVSNWILGGNFRFSTKTNDPLNGTFYIFQVQPDKTYKLLG